MKVLICDHADCMMPDHALEIETLRAGLGEDVEVEVLEYEDDKRNEFYEHVADADALLTAFVTVDAEAMDRAPKLKVVSLNSTGFDQVDLDEATKRGIGVCPVGEYCTWDVAESAIAYMGALNKHFKFYQREIDERHKWDYAAAPQWPRLEDQVLGIVGFGKIGKCPAEKAMGLVKRVIACDPHADDAVFAERGVTRVSKEELLTHADIIVNHMCLTDDNVRFSTRRRSTRWRDALSSSTWAAACAWTRKRLWTRSMRASSVRSARTCCTTRLRIWLRTSW